MDETTAGTGDFQPSVPQKEHQWLKQLVGEWSSVMECSMGPDKPPMKMEGTEVGRSLGDLWVVVEGTGETPGGGVSSSIMTLGYDPQKSKFVGTFIASMMSNLWIYEGSLDQSGTVLTLDTEGPSMAGPGLAKYQDVIEITTDGTRMLRSAVQGPDGTWTPFMTAQYQRRS